MTQDKAPLKRHIHRIGILIRQWTKPNQCAKGVKTAKLISNNNATLFS